MITEVDTLVSTESGLIGMPIEVVIAPSGAVAVADFQSERITVVDPETRNFTAIRAAIDRGEIPDQIRNEVIVAGRPDGRVWIALQTEGLLQQYAADGSLEWSVRVQAAEMEAVRQSPNRYYSLRYFADLFPVGEELWVLMTTLDTGPSAVVLAFGEDGMVRSRIEIRGAAGANALAVDPAKRRVVLSTSHDAQVLMAEVQ